MDDNVIIVWYNKIFVTNKDGSWEYINERNEIKVIRSNCTYKKL